MEKNLISVIVPVYNVANFLEDCLDSILEQTYQNIEVICINDGSTDNSGSILSKYKNKDDRLSVINQSNQGLSAARNSGLEVASGDWITFVDSDDIIQNEFLEKLLHTALTDKSDLIACEYKNFISKTELKNKNIGSETKSSLNSKSFRSLDLYKLGYDGKHGTALNTAWGKLYKRSIFEKIRFPTGKIHEDEYTTYKAFIQSNKATFLKEHLYYYRSRPGSIMKKLEPENEIDVLTAFEDRISAFKMDHELQCLAANDYLIRVSELFYRLCKSKYYGKLVKRYRFGYHKYFNLLSPKAKIERSVAFTMPWLYCKIKDLNKNWLPN